METSSLVAIFGGFMAAHILVSFVSTWARAIVEIRRESAPSRRWTMIAFTSLFNAGPWALVAAGIFVYFEYSARWFPWFLAGVATVVLFYAVLFWKYRKLLGRKSEAKNAA
ncbi:MAG TPA: hypothetical protein VH040_15550 [Usitatibacter sp.]|nr:hypothetical protein [Usitatibacter sp.]